MEYLSSNIDRSFVIAKECSECLWRHVINNEQMVTFVLHPSHAQCNISHMFSSLRFFPLIQSNYLSVWIMRMYACTHRSTMCILYCASQRQHILYPCVVCTWRLCIAYARAMFTGLLERAHTTIAKGSVVRGCALWQRRQENWSFLFARILCGSLVREQVLVVCLCVCVWVAFSVAHN